MIEERASKETEEFIKYNRSIANHIRSLVNNLDTYLQKEITYIVKKRLIWCHLLCSFRKGLEMSKKNGERAGYAGADVYEVIHKTGLFGIVALVIFVIIRAL